MRSVFWFLLVAGLAVASALLLGDNPGTLTVYWAPYRIDASMNLVLLVLVVVFVLLYAAIRGVQLLRRLPDRARDWREQQHEQTLHAQFAEALAFQLSGRFVRAQRAVNRALSVFDDLSAERQASLAPVHALLLWLSAEVAQSLGEPEVRDRWIDQALHLPEASVGELAEPLREGVLLRATAWALDRGDADRADRYLSSLSAGAGRRIQTLRLRLRLARLRHRTADALEMVRLLVKHRALTGSMGSSLQRVLVLDGLRQTHDPEQWSHFWRTLDRQEQAMPEVWLAALEQFAAFADWSAAGDDVNPPWTATLQSCVRSVWQRYADWDSTDRIRVVLALEPHLPLLGDDWLAQLERTQSRYPADPALQYLVGQGCMQAGLWGKAAAALQLSCVAVQHPVCRRRGWSSLARLAEQKGQEADALAAWKQAAMA